MASHPSWIASQLFDKHHTYVIIPLNPCELLATIILHAIPSMWYLFLHSVLKQSFHAPLLR
jgi:hypothetical protein